MDRRTFLCGLAGGLVIARSFAAAQPAAKVYRIGFLGIPTAAQYASRLAAFRAGLSDLGYIEGKNIVIEFRWADGNNSRLPELAAELVGLNVDVIVNHAAGALAARQATTARASRRGPASYHNRRKRLRSISTRCASGCNLAKANGQPPLSTLEQSTSTKYGVLRS